MTIWQSISQDISQSTGRAFNMEKNTTLGGGCINSAYKISSQQGDEYFVKVNAAENIAMFRAEYDGLQALTQAKFFHIPQPICYGTTENDCYLVMTYIPLQSRGDQRSLGHALAKMHEITQSRFGWFQDNTIGSTPQSNTEHPDWTSFWRDERLIPQIQMLCDKGYSSRLSSLSDRLLNKLELILADHHPSASLLHGDLWSGNYAFDEQGKPVIFDPALYYGDRETDVAMTELFGGFSSDFYAAYHETLALAPGYKRRKILYNLYHILNHANLFGASYLNQAISMMERLI